MFIIIKKSIESNIIKPANQSYDLRVFCCDYPCSILTKLYSIKPMLCSIAPQPWWISFTL